MAAATSGPQGGGGDGFQHKPLAGLAGLRPRLPAVETAATEGKPASAGKPELGAKLTVQRERKRRGGKTITRIQGLDCEAGTCAELAKELARALGCGSSVENGDILLQGAQVARAADWLERRGAARVIRGN